VPLYLSEADVEQVLTPTGAVAAVEACCVRMAHGAVANHPRERVGPLAVMAAADEELGVAGVKAYAGAAPLVVLFEEGKPVAVVAAVRLGQLRTGAASAIAARLLSRVGASSLGVLGCGRQARGQVECIRAALPALESVVAYCPTRAHLDMFCIEAGTEAAATPRDAAAQDVVVTATTPRTPSSAAIGFDPARSSARSAPTTEAGESSTTWSSSARRSCAAIRSKTRGSSRPI
jgi:ornithine cyclodeaminase/alanine dehydrogenase-like protein (mu-crystallin family)